MIALAFGEEIRIRHQHPAAFEPLEWQNDFARAGRFCSIGQRLDRRHALRIHRRAHVGDGGVDGFQAFLNLGGQRKAQVHIVALHQRSGVHRHQGHQNALTMGNDLFLATHIPVDQTEHQHRAQCDQTQLQLARTASSGRLHLSGE